jgi:hypothetical protein
MLSRNQAKEILGTTNLSDSELDDLCNDLTVFARTLINQFKDQTKASIEKPTQPILANQDKPHQPTLRVLEEFGYPCRDYLEGKP